jgi:photosystem II stability/assembly factor-like uncharacterized protein
MQLDSRRSALSTISLAIFFGILISLISCSGPDTQQRVQKKWYEDLFSVSFPTEKDGWACGRNGTVLHTADGGKTWARQNCGTDFMLVSIYFKDSQNGWAVGEEGMILYTTDGGKTWEKQKSPVPYILMKVFFVTPLKGWIVTEQTHILSTEDGGKTWQVQFKDEDFILKSISFCDPLHGWAVGEYGYIYSTKDGGKTWKKQAGHFEITKAADEIVGGNYLFDVVAVDPETAWAVGIDGTVTKTTDGGKTWQNVVTGVPKTKLFCVASDRTDTILFGGDGTFLSSTDKGKTWKNPAFDPPIIYGWLYGLTHRGSSGFVAVGGEGAIYLNDGNNPSPAWHRVVY